MNDTISISNTVSKADSDEEVSLLRASMERRHRICPNLERAYSEE